MAKKLNRGLASLKMGVPTALATMPAELTAVEWSKDGTVSLSIGEPETTPLKIEESDDPIAILDGGRTVEITAETYNTSLESFSQFFGGTVAVATWTPGNSLKAADQAVEITTKIQDGKALKIAIPKASIVASMSGNITNKEGLTIKYKITPLVVVTGSPAFTISEV